MYFYFLIKTLITDQEPDEDKKTIGSFKIWSCKIHNVSLTVFLVAKKLSAKKYISLPHAKKKIYYRTTC